MVRLRLVILLLIAIAVWGYAIITDSPAPARGQSQLPEMVMGTVLLSVIALPFMGLRRWFRDRNTPSP